MPVTCYRVVDSRYTSDGTVVAETRSLAPSNTNLAGLLEIVAPSAESARRPRTFSKGRTVGDLSRESWRTYFRVAPRELRAALTLLKSHHAPIVTAIDTGCEVSVCLDFYKDPGGPGNWPRTETGELVHSAKYHHSAAERLAAGAILRTRVVDYVRNHPILRSLTGVAAVPSSTKASVNPLVRGIADHVARELEVPIVDLRRSRSALPQKNIDAARAETNQKNTMRASTSGERGLIVLVDDLMGQGDTVREASRALREAGAVRVGAVVLAKDVTGTRKYKFPDQD